MSSQKGNVKRSRPQKYQNKAAFKNVYHDTSRQTQRVVNTDVTGVCAKCKDCIDWKIKYKKYKPLTQLKTCAACKQKTVKLAYHVYCTPCSSASNKCAKCGDKKDIVMKPKLSEAEQASEDRELQFELEQLPERKRRTFMRLQENGLVTGDGDITGFKHSCRERSDVDSDDDNEDDNENDSADDDISETDALDCEKSRDKVEVASDTENQSVSFANAAGIYKPSYQIQEDTTNENKSNKHIGKIEIAKLSVSEKD